MRYDPLAEPDGTPPTPPPIAASTEKPKRAKSKRPRKPAAVAEPAAPAPVNLLAEVSAVPDSTIAFLFGGPQQQPGQLERNQARVAEIRRLFTAHCHAHPTHSNWRSAWASFMATKPTLETPPGPRILPAPAAAPAAAPISVRFVPTVFTPKIIHLPCRRL